MITIEEKQAIKKLMRLNQLREAMRLRDEIQASIDTLLDELALSEPRLSTTFN